MGWSAAYSTMFEIGPMSEASLGNVGKGNARAGAVDLVITPTLGTGNQESVCPDVRALHTNPGRAFANMMSLKNPCYRHTRPGVNTLAGK